MEQPEVDSPTSLIDKTKDALKKGSNKKNKVDTNQPELLGRQHQIKLKSIIDEVRHLLELHKN